MDPAKVQAVRNKLNKRSYETISRQQALTTKDVAAKGPIWVSKTTFPAPEHDGAREAVLNALSNLGNGDEVYETPPLANIKGEWIGYRSGVGNMESEPAVNEKEKYAGLMRDTASKVTMLYIHGGTFCYGSPATTRPATSTLARLTRGRCFVLQYRLSPQNAFPAALMDVLVAYLSLLYPPAGAWHEPVDPSSLVVVGESAGGTLVLALMLVLRDLYMHQSMPLVSCYSGGVKVPFPAGVACYSAQADQTHALYAVHILHTEDTDARRPSYTENGKFDIFQEIQPCLEPRFPTCPVWPTKPPRGDVYCELSALTHPLISPAVSRTWSGLPPMWLAYGTERLIDDGKLIAQRAADSGVTVQFSEYEGLPHIFAFVFRELPQSAHLFKSWAAFCSACVYKPQGLRSWSKRYRMEGKEVIGTMLEGYSDLDFEAMLEQMEARKRTRKTWTGMMNAKATL